jgi:hypothetical protein
MLQLRWGPDAQSELQTSQSIAGLRISTDEIVGICNFVLLKPFNPCHRFAHPTFGECRREAIGVRRMHRARSGMVRCIDAMIDEMDAWPS